MSLWSWFFGSRGESKASASAEPKPQQTPAAPPSQTVAGTVAPQPQPIAKPGSSAGLGPLLCDAVENGNIDEVRSLLSAGADPNVVGEYTFTPLHRACHHGADEIVRILLDAGAKPDATFVVCPDMPSMGSMTALMSVVTEDKEKIVRLLVDAGADPNRAREDGTTPMLLAALNGRTAVVEMLLRAGAAPNTPNRGGETPVQAARKNGHGEVVKILESAISGVKGKENCQPASPILPTSTKAASTQAKTLGELAATGQWSKLREIVGDVARFAPALGDLNASRHVDIKGHDRSVVLAMLALTTGQPHFGEDVQMAKEALSNLISIGGVGSLKGGDVLMTVFLTVCFFDDLRKSGQQRADVDLEDLGGMIDKLLAPFASPSLDELCRSYGARSPRLLEPESGKKPQDAERSSELGDLVRSCNMQQAMQVLGSIVMKSRTCSDMSQTEVVISLASAHKAGALAVLDHALTSIPNIPEGMRRGITDIAAQMRATGRAQAKATGSLAALSVILPAVAQNRQLSEAAGSLVDALFFSLPTAVR